MEQVSAQRVRAKPRAATSRAWDHGAVRHATPETLEALADLLTALRGVDGIVEKRPGASHGAPAPFSISTTTRAATTPTCASATTSTASGSRRSASSRRSSHESAPSSRSEQVSVQLRGRRGHCRDERACDHVTNGLSAQAIRDSRATVTPASSSRTGTTSIMPRDRRPGRPDHPPQSSCGRCRAPFAADHGRFRCRESKTARDEGERVVVELQSFADARHHDRTRRGVGEQRPSASDRPCGPNPVSGCRAGTWPDRRAARRASPRPRPRSRAPSGRLRGAPSPTRGR